MNSLNGVYEFTYSIDKLTGEPTHRHGRRKGDLLKILHIRDNQPMLVQYMDGSGVLRTSHVKSWVYDGNSVFVETSNTYYRFNKVFTKPE